jgi:hypothetical protein
MFKRLLTLGAVVLALVLPVSVFAARTNDLWVLLSGATSIQPNFPSGIDLLLIGSSHYINFNTISGTSGYGFRDNAGQMEFKNSGGAWTAFGAGGGGGGGGGGGWTFIAGGIYNSTTTDQVMIDETSTSSNAKLEVNGALNVIGAASSTSFTNSGTSWLTGLTSKLLGTDNTGKVVGTTSVGTNYLTGLLDTINGTAFNVGDSKTITAASSTLLGDQNTFSGATTTFSNGVSFKDFSLNGTVISSFGSGISTASGVLSVSGLTTANFSSANISQWTNNSNFITLASLSATTPLNYNASTGLFTFSGVATSTPPTIGNLAYWTAANTLGTVATTSVTCAGTASCTSFNALGSAPVTITGAAFPDLFTHPAASQSATTSLMIFNTGGLIVNAASSTIVGNATTTGMFEANIASSTKTYGAGLRLCQSGNVLTYDGAGKFGCAADATGAGGGSWPFTTSDTNYGIPVQSTTTPEWFKTPASGIFSLMASSTVSLVNASTSLLSASTIYTNTVTAKDTSSSIFIRDSSFNNYLEINPTYITLQGSGSTAIYSSGSINFENDATNPLYRFWATSGGLQNLIFAFSALSADRTITWGDLSGSPVLGSYATGFAGGSIPFGSAGLLATSSTLTFSSGGSLLTVTNASTTNLTASQSFFGANLTNCTGTSFLQWTSSNGQFGCGTPSGTGGGADSFTHTSVYGQTTSATSTLLSLTGSPFSLVASSTVEFVYASSTAGTFFSNLYLPYIGAYQLLETDGGKNVIATTSIGNNLLQTSGVTGGSYTNTNITVNDRGIVTSAANGTAGGGGGDPFYHPTATRSATTTETDFYGNASSTMFEATSTVWLGNTKNGLISTDVNGKVGLTASSTIFGTGTGGQLLTWLNGVPTWAASTTYTGTSPMSLTFLAGQVTASIANAAADGATKGAASFNSSDFDAASGNISLDYTNGQAASVSNKGFLTSADWATFNGKLNFSNLFTIATTFGSTTMSTTTPIWAKTGIFASSTSQFDQSSTTQATIGTLYVNNDKITDLTGANLVNTAGALSVSLSSLSPDGTSITGSAFNGSGAISNWSVNMANANTWTAKQTFGAASTTDLSASNSFYLPFAGGLVYSDANKKATTIATSSVTCSGNISCTGFAAIGASTISFTGTLGLSSGGTNASLSGANQIPYMNSGNTALTNDSLFQRFATQGSVAIGTSTAQYGILTLGSSTAPELLLGDDVAADNLWAVNVMSGNLYISTSTATATSSQSVVGFSLTNYVWQFFSNVLIKISSATAFVVKDGFGTSVLTVNTASTTGPILQVQATSSSDTLFQVDQYGHLLASSTRATPTLSSCGVSPTLAANANDVTGTINAGSGGITACTLTFASPYTTTPTVIVSDNSTTAVTDVSAVSTTAFTVSFASSLTSPVIYYLVVQP